MHILLIYAHLTYPGWSEGRLNRTFLECAHDFFTERGHQVATTFIEHGYNVDAEVAKHAAADRVILQTPVNWFSTPWIHKKYVDQVFNAGLHQKALLTGDGRTRSDPSKQYGTGGSMQGRKFMVSATWNAPRDVFDNPDSILFAGKGTADIFLHITANYRFMAYEILPDFGVFDVFKHLDIPRSLTEYRRHLETHCL